MLDHPQQIPVLYHKITIFIPGRRATAGNRQIPIGQDLRNIAGTELEFGIDNGLGHIHPGSDRIHRQSPAILPGHQHPVPVMVIGIRYRTIHSHDLIQFPVPLAEIGEKSGAAAGNTVAENLQSIVMARQHRHPAQIQTDDGKVVERIAALFIFGIQQQGGRTVPVTQILCKIFKPAVRRTGLETPHIFAGKSRPENLTLTVPEKVVLIRFPGIPGLTQTEFLLIRHALTQEHQGGFVIRQPRQFAVHIKGSAVGIPIFHAGGKSHQGVAVIFHGLRPLHFLCAGKDHVVDDRFHKGIEPEKRSGFQSHVFPGTAQFKFGSSHAVFAIFGLIMLVKIPGNPPGGEGFPCGMAVTGLCRRTLQSESAGTVAGFRRILLIKTGRDLFPDAVKNGVFLHQIPIEDHLQRPIMIGAFQRPFDIPECFIIPPQNLGGHFRRGEGKAEKFSGKFNVAGSIEKSKIFAQLIPGECTSFAIAPGTFPDLGIVADSRDFFSRVKSNIHEIPQLKIFSGRGFGNHIQQFFHGGPGPGFGTASRKNHIVFIPENIVGTA